MKKLLTIICALSLIMAFSVPAMADEPIVDDTQLTVGAIGNAIANDNATAIEDSGNFSGNLSGNTASDDDNVNVLSGNTASDDDNVNVLSGNTDNSDDDFMSDNDNSVNDSFKVDNEWKNETEIKTEIDDIASDNDNREDYAENNGDAAWKGGEIDNSTETAEGDNVATKGGEITTVEMEDNQAAAAMGGFALAIEIEDIELNLASTTSVSGIYQESKFAPESLLGFSGEDGVDFDASCNKVEASVYSNTGVTGATFTSGNFNNSANLNSVTMTVQY